MSVTVRAKTAARRTIASIVSAAANAYHSQYYYAKRWHPQYALLTAARDEAAAYVTANMPEAMVCRDTYDILSYASKHVTVDGLHLEFGVRTGNSVNHMARRNRSTVVYGFDSFEGLPERWSGMPMDAGTFAGEGIPRVESNVRLEIGWFDDTLPPFLARTAGDVALAHVDSDIYSSARTVLDNLAPRLVPGSIIVFNEYFNYPNWRAHEFRAWQEFCATHTVRYEYLAWAMYEVAVIVRALDTASTGRDSAG